MGHYDEIFVYIYKICFWLLSEIFVCHHLFCWYCVDDPIGWNEMNDLTGWHGVSGLIGWNWMNDLSGWDRVNDLTGHCY